VYKCTESIKELNSYKGIDLVALKTVEKKGFDTIIHSMKATFHIILKNTGNVIHIQNGGNSIWALLLRMFGKKVFVSQDGVDWKREKWPWYAKIYLRASTLITAYVPNRVIFDNVFAKRLFEKQFNKKFNFIPFGSEVTVPVKKDEEVLSRLGVTKNEYFLFVGRFIPDKGLHYLIPAFEKVKTDKKLVMVGGSPNPSIFEKKLRDTKDTRICFPGYIYGGETVALMKHAYAYVQPSDVEGLSPVILSVMGLGTPVICSDIEENLYVVDNTALTFKKGNIPSLEESLNFSLNNYDKMKKSAIAAKKRAVETFTWKAVVDQHITLFNNETG